MGTIPPVPGGGLDTAELRRLDRASLEARATRTSALLWAATWVAVGVAAKLVWQTWYGFGAGFLVGMLLSAPVIWFFYARPSVRERKVVRASWTGTTLRVFDPMTGGWEQVDFGSPHKAFFIVAKGERRFLLRLEQEALDPVRIDIVGPLPMALPMQPVGDARSLAGFLAPRIPGRRKTVPYILRPSPDAERAALSLLAFVARFGSTRIAQTAVPKGDVRIVLAPDCFVLERADGRRIRFDDFSSIRVRTATSLETADSEWTGKVTTATLYLALIPPSGEEDALVFGLVVPVEWHREVHTWQLPPFLRDRVMTLYDDSVHSCIANRLLRTYIKHIDPSNPVLDVLRH